MPPGPRMPMAVQSLLLWRGIDRFIEHCINRYGPVFTARIAPMGTLVYITEPDEIKRVFTGDTSVFHAGEANGTVLAKVMGRHSVLILDEDEHLRQRRRMLPPFHGESVRRYGEVIEEVTRSEIESWPLGTPFELHPRMNAITLEVIMRAVIGVEDEARLAELRRLLPGLVSFGPVVMLSWVYPRLNAVGPWRRFEELKKTVDDVLYDEIRRRRADAQLDQRVDILSLLIRGSEGEQPMTDEELRDQLITLLLAGHETTATGLAWAFERLLRHPAALDRLREEIDAGEDAYLDAVVKEILRVRPVIFDVARKLKKPVEVAGYTLPAGVTVMPGVGVVQRSESHWPSPRDFRPERFLDGQPEPYTWIPFGGGTRRCLGAAFATFEMKTVLRTILAELDLRADRPEPEPVRMKHITLVPARGARAVVTGRRRAESGSFREPAASYR
ncbi:MAG TPA: cytochrome P450 [Thermoleophilaceae bacterium]|nr:cytochrome P450 [Thermoleophilaceae bacterium]